MPVSEGMSDEADGAVIGNPLGPEESAEQLNTGLVSTDHLPA